MFSFFACIIEVFRWLVNGDCSEHHFPNCVSFLNHIFSELKDFLKNLSSSPLQCRSWTLGRRNSDRKEVAVLENEYRRDKWQVLPASIIQTQADVPAFQPAVPAFQPAGHKTPLFAALRARHFSWFLGQFRSQIHLSLEPRCICHSPSLTGWAEHLSCPVWITALHCLAPVSSALSLPYCRSFAISSVPTSFHSVRPWYRAAKQQKDLISTDLVTIECSQGCWASLRWNERGNLAHWVSYKWWIPRLRDLSTVKLLEKGERRQSLFLFRKHWKVFLI